MELLIINGKLWKSNFEQNSSSFNIYSLITLLVRGKEEENEKEIGNKVRIPFLGISYT